jgi:hypothetical protein
VYFGNAPASAADSSVVIDRVGDLDIARAVAARLGIRRVISEPDTTLLVEATVVVGVDWRAASEGAADGPDPNAPGLLRRMLPKN